MAGFFQQFLGDAAKGFLTNDYLRDYTHASKTFVSNAYGYAPKYKFLFHVYFETNDSDITSLQEPVMPTDRNYGLAVKTVQLPKYSFDLHTMNQYNRKRIIQTKIKYEPIQIQFHDDNSNLINKLWYAYYTYYYKDALQADPVGSTSTRKNGDKRKTKDINKRTIYDSNISQDDDWGYIGEPDTASQSYSKDPFFRSINIYGFNQHNFVLYRLINPMIQSFSHDTYSYNEGNGVMENSMTLEYETVKYYTGAVDGKNPSQVVPKFGDVGHYDTRLSPLAAPGSNSSIMGQGGLIASAGGIMEDIENGNFLGAARGIVNTAKQFSNPQTLINGIKGEAIAASTNWLTGSPNRNNLFNFPSSPGGVANDINSTIGKGVSGVSESIGNYVNTSSSTGQNSPASSNYTNQMDRTSDTATTASINKQISIMAANVNLSSAQVSQQNQAAIAGNPTIANMTPAQVSQQIKNINNGR